MLLPNAAQETLMAKTKNSRWFFIAVRTAGMAVMVLPPRPTKRS
jgi:hypothetical protein